VSGHRLGADLPQHWLLDPAYRRLSDAAWRLHTHALMWAIGQTNGLIPDDILPVLGGEGRRAAIEELMAFGHWVPVTGGWQVARWAETQNTVAEIEGNRRREREKKQRQRSARSGDLHTEPVPPGRPQGESRGGVPGGSRGEESRAENSRVNPSSLAPQASEDGVAVINSYLEVRSGAAPGLAGGQARLSEPDQDLSGERAGEDQAPGNRDLGDGTCPECGTTVSVMRSGRLRPHGGTRRSRQCKGSGQAPAGEVTPRW
jgi:hypothetical protein